jgi:Protein of unknown function (DUF3738)
MAKDKTGLTGLYDFTLIFTLTPTSPLPPPSSQASKSQLGLKLEFQPLHVPDLFRSGRQFLAVIDHEDTLAVHPGFYLLSGGRKSLIC